MNFNVEDFCLDKKYTKYIPPPNYRVLPVLQILEISSGKCKGPHP